MDAFLSAIRTRAQELREQGLTETRVFRALAKEFPGAERDTLVDAAKLAGHRRGISPRWTEWGGSLRPTQMRFQKKEKGGRPEDDEVKIRTLTPRKGKWLRDY